MGKLTLQQGKFDSWVDDNVDTLYEQLKDNKFFDSVVTNTRDIDRLIIIKSGCETKDIFKKKVMTYLADKLVDLKRRRRTK